jgi:hypothetical protein
MPGDDWVKKLRQGDAVILDYGLSELTVTATVMDHWRETYTGIARSFNDGSGLIHLSSSSGSLWYRVRSDGSSPFGGPSLIEVLKAPTEADRLTLLENKVDKLTDALNNLIDQLKQAGGRGLSARTGSRLTALAKGIADIAPLKQPEPHDPEALRQLIRE